MNTLANIAIRAIVKNVRQGFATNSSSSHSFVYLKEAPREDHDTAPRTVRAEFHWDDFRLETLRDKLFYVLVTRVSGGWGKPAADVDVLYEKMKDEFPEFTKEDFAEATTGSIDHESNGLGNSVGIEGARDPRLVIYGGNDNITPHSAMRAQDVAAARVDWERSKVKNGEHQSDTPLPFIVGDFVTVEDMEGIWTVQGYESPTRVNVNRCARQTEENKLTWRYERGIHPVEKVKLHPIQAGAPVEVTTEKDGAATGHIRGMSHCGGDYFDVEVPFVLNGVEHPFTTLEDDVPIESIRLIESN